MTLRICILFLLPAIFAGCVCVSSTSNASKGSETQAAVASELSEHNSKKLAQYFNLTNEITLETGYVPARALTGEPPVFAYYSREVGYMPHASETDRTPVFYFQGASIVCSPPVRHFHSEAPTGHRDLGLIDTTPMPPVNVDAIRSTASGH